MVPELIARDETINGVTALTGVPPFQFNLTRSIQLPTNLFRAFNEEFTVTSINRLMQDTNVPYQDRINITETLVHIDASLDTLSYTPMAVVLSHSTFFAQLLTNTNATWNGRHIISVTARDFILRVIIHPCLLHRVLTPHLDYDPPA